MAVMARFGRRLAILALILAFVLVSAGLYLLQSGYSASVVYAKEKALKSDLFLMRGAIDNYASEKGRCPDSLKVLADDLYIRAIPVDPMTGLTTTWMFIRDATKPGCDVRSGSPQQARDGSRYADW
jgi:general secretion pathway protein G